VLKDRRLQRADLHRTASDSSDTKQRYSIEPTFDEKDGEETMAEERSYTPFDLISLRDIAISIFCFQKNIFNLSIYLFDVYL